MTRKTPIALLILWLCPCGMLAAALNGTEIRPAFEA